MRKTSTVFGLHISGVARGDRHHRRDGRPSVATHFKRRVRQLDVCHAAIISSKLVSQSITTMQLTISFLSKAAELTLEQAA